MLGQPKHISRHALSAVVAAFALAVSLVGCTPTAIQVTGFWGEPDQEGMPVLELGANGALSGSDGCNQLVGEYVANGSSLVFEEVASTKMFCEGVDTWLSGLATATVESDSMIIFDSAGVEIGSLTRAE